MASKICCDECGRDGDLRVVTVNAEKTIEHGDGSVRLATRDVKKFRADLCEDCLLIVAGILDPAEQGLKVA